MAAGDGARDGGPIASEPCACRAVGRSLPPNTRAPSVLGNQPQTFARGREVAALLLWTLAVFFALALASYAGEPGSAVAPATDGVESIPPIVGEDWVGVVGAVVAKCFVNLVGVMSWVVPFEALLLGIPFVTGRKSKTTAARLAGDILLVVIGASLVEVGWPEKVAFGKYPAGGMVGELFGEIARSLFSTVGSFLVGFALVGLILISRASFSFIALMRAIARVFNLVVDRVRGGARSAAERVDDGPRARSRPRGREAPRRRAGDLAAAFGRGDDPRQRRGSDARGVADRAGGTRAPRVRTGVGRESPVAPTPIVLEEEPKKPAAGRARRELEP